MTVGRLGLVSLCATSWLLVVGCVASAIRAQEPLAAALVTKAQALGGRTSDVAFDGDGSHALSAGWNGDLLWWDCATHTVLRSWPPFARYASKIAVHPSGDWALVGIAHEDETYGLLRIDPATGAAVELAQVRALVLAFSPRRTLRRRG